MIKFTRVHQVHGSGAQQIHRRRIFGGRSLILPAVHPVIVGSGIGQALTADGGGPNKQTTKRGIGLAVRSPDEDGSKLAKRISGHGSVYISRDGIENPTIPTAFRYCPIDGSSQWRSFMNQPLPEAESPRPSDPGIIGRLSYRSTLLGITFGFTAGSIVYNGKGSWIRPFGVLLDGMMFLRYDRIPHRDYGWFLIHQ